MSRGGGKTGIFLMELLIAVLVFSLCSAMCLKVFASAKRMSAGATELSRAVDAATSAAECWKEYGSLEGIQSALGGSITDAKSGTPDVGTLRVNGTENGLEYVMTVAASGAFAYIEVTGGDGETVYTLTARAVSADA